MCAVSFYLNCLSVVYACLFIFWSLCVHSGMHYFIHVFVDVCAAVAGRFVLCIVPLTHYILFVGDLLMFYNRCRLWYAA